ncbi:MAG: hypothetical protein M1828_004109 [Chrysothrix sp. TS-e1954]|nr:MAG: hypothetical protein M1828_004109 [Chrysothrix sp. TS-e1954]
MFTPAHFERKRGQDVCSLLDEGIKAQVTPRKHLDNLPQEIFDGITNHLDSDSCHALFQTSRALRVLAESAHYSNITVCGHNARNDFLRFLLQPAPTASRIKRRMRFLPEDEQDNGLAKFHKREYIKLVVLGFGRAEVPFKDPDDMDIDGEPEKPREGLFDICQIVQLVAQQVPKAEIRIWLMEQRFPRLAGCNTHEHRFPNVEQIHVEYCGSSYMSYFNDTMTYDGEATVISPKPTQCFDAGNPTDTFCPFECDCSRHLAYFLDRSRFPDLQIINISSTGKAPSQPPKGVLCAPFEPVQYARLAPGRLQYGLDSDPQEIIRPDHPPKARMVSSMFLGSFQKYEGCPLSRHMSLHTPPQSLTGWSLQNLRRLTFKDCAFSSKEWENLLMLLPTWVPACSEFRLIETPSFTRRQYFPDKPPSCVCHHIARYTWHMKLVDIMKSQICAVLVVSTIFRLHQRFGAELEMMNAGDRLTLNRFIAVDGTCARPRMGNRFCTPGPTTCDGWATLETSTRRAARESGKGYVWTIGAKIFSWDPKWARCWHFLGETKFSGDLADLMQDLEDNYQA